MAKTIKFNLILDEKPVRDIKGLQENFCIDDILAFYQNGLLQKWLKVRSFDDYLKKVEAIKDNDSAIIALIKIFDIEKSEKEIMEATYSLAYWDERKIELEEWNKKNTKIKEIIADYHNGYDVLKADIVEKKEDMPFLKTAAQDIFETYLEIFKIDFIYFYNNYIESVPLMILAVLMNKNLRDIYLKDTHIKNDLKRFQHNTDNHNQVYQTDTNNRWETVCNEPVRVLFLIDNSKVWVNDKASNDGRFNANGAIGKTFDKLYFRSYASGDKVEYVKLYDIQYKYDKLKSILQFKGQTDGYWKDLEIESSKVMVLSIPAGTFIRSANKPTEELSTNDVNGNFLILDGLVYKSNDDKNPILYMEV